MRTLPKNYLYRSFALALLIMTGLSSGSNAQNAAWSVDANGNWADGLNWVGGSAPGANGVATFDDSYGMSGQRGVVNNATPTLSGITFDSNFVYSLGGGTVNLTAGQFNLNVLRSNGSSPSILNFGHTISSALAGTSSSFNKTGSGIVRLANSANSFVATGGINITGGVLAVATGDNALGNSSNALNIDGGELHLVSSSFSSSRAINVGSNGAVIGSFVSSISFSGAFSGNGLLTLQSTPTSSIFLSGNSSGFTGAMLQDRGNLSLLGPNGTLSGISGIDLARKLTLDNANANANNRINDAGNMTLRGAQFVMAGNNAGSNEQVGNLILAGGDSSVFVSSAVNSSSIRFAGLQRNHRGKVYFLGTNLGLNSPTAVSSNIVFDNSPGALVGGGGPLSSTIKDISILPFALGVTSTGTNANSGDFVSWNSTNGRIFVLTANNYATLATAGVNDNVSVTSATSVNSGGQTINALKMATTLDGGAGDTLTITSGAVATVGSTAATINANLNFGNAEGVLHANANTTINGSISGTNGLTKSGIGSLTLRGNRDYTGTTTINSGDVFFNETVSAGVAGVFGADTSAIVLNSTSSETGQSTPTRLLADGNGVTAFNRDLEVNTGSSSYVSMGTLTNGPVGLVINGNIQINNSSGSRLNGLLNVQGRATVNGIISGAGALRSDFSVSSTLTLNGENSYSGGTDMNGGTFFLGHDKSLGTGKVWVSFATNVQAIGGPRVIANDVDLISGAVTFTGSNALTFNSNVFLNGVQSNIGVFTANGVTLAGNVHGGSLLKTGFGNLTLTNTSNAYTGTTILRNGTLTLGGDALYGSGVLGRNLGLGGAGSVIMGNSTGASDNLALLVNGAYTMARNINVNNDNSFGTTTIGGTNTSGNSNFSGIVFLGRPVTRFTAAAGGSTTFSGGITGGNGESVVKVGGGTLIYNNNHFYTGTTTVSQGQLIVNGTHSNGSNYTVQANAALGGTGRLANSDVNILEKGFLRPGNDLGTLRIDQSLNMAGVYEWQIASPLLADVVTVGGNLLITGQLSLNLLPDLDIERFDKFTLFAYQGTFSGAFTNPLDGWLINYQDKLPGLNPVAQAGAWKYVTLKAMEGRPERLSRGVKGYSEGYSAVPEPSSLLLVAIPLILSIRRRR